MKGRSLRASASFVSSAVQAFADLALDSLVSAQLYGPQRGPHQTLPSEPMRFPRFHGAAISLATTIVATSAGTQTPTPTPPYRDASRPVDERVRDLLGRMSGDLVVPPPLNPTIASLHARHRPARYGSPVPPGIAP